MEEGFYWYKWREDVVEDLKKKPDVNPELVKNHWSVMFHCKSGQLLMLGVDGPQLPEQAKDIEDKMVIGPRIEEMK